MCFYKYTSMALLKLFPPFMIFYYLLFFFLTLLIPKLFPQFHLSKWIHILLCKYSCMKYKLSTLSRSNNRFIFVFIFISVYAWSRLISRLLLGWLCVNKGTYFFIASLRFFILLGFLFQTFFYLCISRMSWVHDLHIIKRKYKEHVKR